MPLARPPSSPPKLIPPRMIYADSEEDQYTQGQWDAHEIRRRLVIENGAPRSQRMRAAHETCFPRLERERERETMTVALSQHLGVCVCVCVCVRVAVE